MASQTFNDYGALPPENVNEPHQHVIFVLDRSISMNGKPLENLLRAVNRFPQDVCQDPTAARVIETAVIAFNDQAEVIQDWRPISDMKPISLVAGGSTNISIAMNLAIKMCRERTSIIPTECHKPVVVLVTDGYGGDVTEVAKVVQQRIADKKMQMWILCVKGYDEATVAALCQKDASGKPKCIAELVDEDGYDFSQFFGALSKSIKAVSVSSPGSKVHVPQAPEEKSNLQVPDLDAWLNDD